MLSRTIYRLTRLLGKEARGGDDLRLLQEIDPDRLPRHIAIIMDGNRRWARGKGLPTVAGHRAGVDSLREIVDMSARLGIDVVTVYAFSTENWHRPKDEVDFLLELLLDVLDHEVAALHQNGIRVRVIGRVDGLSPTMQERVRRAIDLTAKNKRLTLNVALNYGGRAEIVDGVRALAEMVRQGALDSEQIDEEEIGRHLYTAGQPDPDLVIRTGGEYRLSNFMLWQLAYAEIWITPVYWPEFRRAHLLEAIVQYQRRNRRFGRV